MRKFLNACLMLCIPIYFSSCSLNRVNNIEVTEISKIVISIKSGELLEIEAVPISEGGDPVLHLMDNDGNQLAYDNNGGQGLGAKISYTAEKSDKYILIIRSKNSTSSGTCNVLKNGSLWKINTPFGGTHLQLGGMGKNEIIEIIKPPNGPHNHIALLVNSSKKEIQNVVVGSYSSKYLVSEKVYKQNIIIGKLSTSDMPHPFEGNKLRVYVNDAQVAGSDKDQDGIGDKLERAIGTCSDLTAIVTGRDGEVFECYLAADPRDTDGDGISDGQELLGKHGTQGKRLPLPTWGADPRHKDYFVEVDFKRRTALENENQVKEYMLPIYARNFAKIFADSFETSAFFKLYNAKVLRNPDNKPGINAHLDVGIAPEKAEDVSLYGDWNGYTAVDAIQDEDGEWKGVSRDDAYLSNMDPFRKGVFKYSLGVAGGRGQCGIGAFSCDFNFHDSNIPAHETGHSLGIGHSGIPYYYDKVDPNCNPAYLSIMNYVYQNKQNMGFSSRPQYSPLNNYEVEEWEAVSPDFPYFQYLTSIFKYYVDPIEGHVDWNRDGVFAPKGTKVRAYINYAPGTGCEFTRYNQYKITDGNTDKSPVLAKLNNKLYLFYKPLTTIAGITYQTSTSNWNCPTPQAEEGCNDGAWGAKNNALIGSSGGFDIARIDSSNQRLLLVSNWVNGFLWFNELNENGSWSNPNIISNSSKAKGTPAMAVINSNKVMLSYKGEDNILRYRYYQKRSGQWKWTEEQIAYTDLHQAIELSDDASPSLIYAQLEWNNNAPTMYGALTLGAVNNLRLWAFNVATSTWKSTNLIEPAIIKAVGKPEMEWIPAEGHFNGLGRLYLFYNRNYTEKTVPRMLISYHKVNSATNERTQIIGLESYFDNSDYSSKGFDIFYDSDSANGNLMYAGGFPSKQTQIYFRPKANALNNITYYNLNDWETMGKLLCKTVVNPDGSISNPINCH